VRNVDDSKRLEMEGKWDQARGRVKEAWGVLTDDELDRTEGKWDRLVGLIKERTERMRLRSRGSSETSSTRFECAGRMFRIADYSLTVQRRCVAARGSGH
jgi:uncharacterized protein YjbJ (UPF0337 family)